MFQKICRVFINVKLIGLCHLDHCVDQRTGSGTFWCCAEQPVFLPTVNGRMAFSLKLLERLQCPSSRYVINVSFRFWAYFTAVSKRLPLRGFCSSSLFQNASSIGFSFSRLLNNWGQALLNFYKIINLYIRTIEIVY